MFVGNITERAPDSMVRHLLTTCGPVLSWKRVQGATGQLQVREKGATSINRVNSELYALPPTCVYPELFIYVGRWPTDLGMSSTDGIAHIGITSKISSQE